MHLIDPVRGIVRRFEKTRGNKSVVFIEFAGPIGSGKTTTCKLLCELLKSRDKEGRYKVVRLEESVQKNEEAISDFYRGGGDAAELEDTICGNRIEMIASALIEAADENDEKVHIIVSDRSIEEDIAFIHDLILKRGRDRDLIDIKNCIKRFVCFLNSETANIKHIVAYLNCDYETALHRVKERGRDFEGSLKFTDIVRLSTLESDEIFEGTIMLGTNNSKLSAKETAIVTFFKLATVCNEIRSLTPKVLISLYGVPGCGKTHMSCALYDKLRKCSEIVLDGSEEKDIVQEQEKVYTKDDGAMGPDDIQDTIDSRRLASFRALNGDKPIVITDVGPETSGIFREFTKCIRLECGYKRLVSENFDYLINIYIGQAEGIDFNVVRDHIKERGRPGEYEYFTEECLSGIDKVILKHIITTSKYYKKSINLTLDNDFTSKSDSSVIANTLEALWDATSWF